MPSRGSAELSGVSDSKLIWASSAGDSQPMDVCSVHHNNTFLRYSVSLLGYGFYGDLLADSETKRWLGPARYDLAGTSGLRPMRLLETTQFTSRLGEGVGGDFKGFNDKNLSLEAPACGFSGTLFRRQGATQDRELTRADCF